jgi:serine/threonine protein kinase
LGPVAKALDHAHSVGLAHRDIKPTNILVSEDGKNVRVIDFQLASEIRSSISRFTKLQVDTSGTYPYMAPEQFRGQWANAQTDQYALAMVMYELLAGQLPYEPHSWDQWKSLVTDEKTTLPNVPGLPKAIQESLARGLSRDPQQRPVSCIKFLKSLIPNKEADPPKKPTPDTKDNQRKHGGSSTDWKKGVGERSEMQNNSDYAQTFAGQSAEELLLDPADASPKSTINRMSRQHDGWSGVSTPAPQPEAVADMQRTTLWHGVAVAMLLAVFYAFANYICLGKHYVTTLDGILPHMFSIPLCVWVYWWQLQSPKSSSAAMISKLDNFRVDLTIIIILIILNSNNS